MENNKTAVDWLVEKLNQCEPWYSGTNVPVDYINQLIEQAKQMEKEKILDAHIEGQRVFDKHPHTQWTNDQAEQYYNETYNKEQQ